MSKSVHKEKPLILVAWQEDRADGQGLWHVRFSGFPECECSGETLTEAYGYLQTQFPRYLLQLARQRRLAITDGLSPEPESGECSQEPGLVTLRLPFIPKALEQGMSILAEAIAEVCSSPPSIQRSEAYKAVVAAARELADSADGQTRVWNR